MSAYLKVAPSQIANYPGVDGEASRKYWARRVPFKRTSDVEHLLDGFRKAGLPV
jgi:hypothetical protein